MILTYYVWRFMTIPLIYWLFIGLEESTVLRDSLATFIPENYSVQDVITDDAMFTAWDLNNRNPRFFSKWYQQNEQTKDFNNDLPLLDMIWTSASTPYYFKPAVVQGDVYTAGTYVAKSPAFFAYLYANDKGHVAG